MQDSRPLIIRSSTDFPALRRAPLDTLQVNLGYLCNLSCVHCHVNAGPNRTEMMDDDTLDLILEVLARHRLSVLDLTGGAPEMHPRFRWLVEQASALGVQVVDRSNLTILLEPGHEDLVDFLARHQVHVVASLPCYEAENVDAQRGKGVYDGSIEALLRLNDAGYGDPARALALDLVYNPAGAQLPPDQGTLEQAYRRELDQRFGIRFNRLLTITNMPIARFGAILMAHNEFEDYMRLLRQNHRDANLPGVMCRTQVSVDYQGYLYDCDFNQMLDLRIRDQLRSRHLRDLLAWDPEGDPIRVADHCFGCTAGAGSSCGGALSA